MDFLSTAAIGSLIAFTLLHLLTSLLATKRLPPGPIRLPLIGSLHLLGNLPHKSLANLAKKHGPIMSLKLGQITTVVISSSEIAKEVFQKHDLVISSRPIPNAVHASDHYKYSLVWLPLNSRWRSLRKLLNSNIFSVKRLDANQHLRSKKVQELIDFCRKNSETGQAVDIGRAVFRTSLNLLSNTIFSKDLTDPFSDSAKEFRELVCNIMMEGGKRNLVDVFPILEKLDPHGLRQRLTIHFEKMLHLFRGLIDERLSSSISQGAAGDVLDVLLTACQQTPEEIDRKHIEHLCLDLFVAGTDTTSNTVEWAMTELLKNPEKMKKTQAEIAQVIGKGKVIQDEDVARLPYLQCVVKETLRIHPPGPLNMRQFDQQVDVGGYNIPKGTQVIFNIWAFGHDETIWKDAAIAIFEPERFLESEIDMRGQDFELIPFGSGRRMCPGLPLAVRMVHVMLGSLLNCFDWKLECGIAPEDLDMEEIQGLALQKASPLLAVPIPLLLL